MRTSAFLFAIVFAASLSAETRLAPNTIKYRDTSAPHATGRDGNVVVEARALLGSDRKTTLEVTTGSLDDPSGAPGNLDKVQVKIGDLTTNHNNLAGGGSYTETLDGLQRGDKLQVQANVSGIDGRTAVVTLDETVKKRPDLEMAWITAPGNVTANAPVIITATLYEINGDVGARTNCVLRANDQVVDVARDVWVDAGDSVTCIFHATFPTPGRVNLMATAEDVRPGDWIPYNNHVTSTLTVRDELGWKANASQKTTRTLTKQWWTDDPEHPDEDDRTVVDDRINFTATIDAPLQFGENMSVRYHEYTDGQKIRDEYVGLTWYRWPSSKCVSNFDRSLTMGLCQEDGITTVNVVRTGGTTRYLSKGWFQYYNGETYAYDQYVIDDITTFGTPFRYGNTVDLQITLDDGQHVWTAAPFLNLEPYQNPDQFTSSCTTFSSGRTSCTEKTVEVSGKTAAADSH